MQSLQPANVETKVTCNSDESKVVKCDNSSSGAHFSSAFFNSQPSTSGDKKLLFLNYLSQRSSTILIKHLVEEEDINMVVLNLKPGDDYTIDLNIVKSEEGDYLGHNREEKVCPTGGHAEEDKHLLRNRDLNACLVNGETEDNQLSYTQDVLLDYVDRQELPYALVDKWSSKYPQLFYNGCVIVQIKDDRYSEEPQVRYTVLRPHNQSLINDTNLIADALGARSYEDRLFLESSIVKGAHEDLNLNPSTAVGLRRFRKHICSSALLTNKPLRPVARHSQRLSSKRPKVEDGRLGQFAEVPSNLQTGSHDQQKSHLILRSILKPDEHQQWKSIQDVRSLEERLHQNANYNDCKSIQLKNSAIHNEHGSHCNVNDSNPVPVVHQEAHKLVPQLNFKRRLVIGQKDAVQIPSIGSVDVSNDSPSSSSSGNSSASGCVVRSRLHFNHAFTSNSQRQTGNDEQRRVDAKSILVAR